MRQADDTTGAGKGARAGAGYCSGLARKLARTHRLAAATIADVLRERCP